MKVGYLATPFQYKGSRFLRPFVELYRFYKVSKISGKLMKDGMIVFSPVTHGYPIAMACKLPVDWNYWKETCEHFLQGVDILYVLMLPGWKQSTGVKAEIDIAISKKIPIHYLTPDGLLRWISQ